MAQVSPRQVCSPSFTLQPALPTPSPFTNSLASSGGWRSSQSTSHISNILLRFFSFLFSAISFLSLFAPIPHNSILRYHEFRYCLTIAIFASIYSALQLLKGIHDIAFGGRYISDKKWDYITFFMDQLIAYLLISSAPASALSIERIERRLKKVAITSVTMSVAAFLVVAVCGLISGYRLCKRISW